MLSNKTVIQNFLNRTACHNVNLESTGNRLINYSTCIAEWYGYDLIINTTKYSPTTSKIQNLLIRLLNDSNDYRQTIELDNIQINTVSLVNKIINH